MLVDMAFADVYVGEKTPTVANNRIILRSFGKFFGMAGLRLGFVYLPEKLRAAFVSHLPLWAVSSLSLWVAEAALTDVTWHQRQRQRITAARDALFYYAKQRFMGCEIVRGPMFVSVYGNYEYLKQCQQRFAECGVWLRLFYLPEAMPNTYLRLGLPADIKRLEQVTKSLEL